MGLKILFSAPEKQGSTAHSMRLAAAYRFLEGTQNVDGGWGYHPRGRSLVEPTGAVLLALADVPESPSLSPARAWLERAQRPDGGWGMDPDESESDWGTAWAVLALARLDPRLPLIARGIQWLRDVPSIRIHADELTAEVRRMLRIDPSLRGWPWRPGEASWVEPTALALLAMHAASSIEAHRDRVEEAIRYLIDRRCQGGGWNFGNPFMLGAYLPPRPHPTAWVLLALQAIAPDAIRSEDVEALRAEMHRDGGTMALALGHMALTALGVEDHEVLQHLFARQGPDGSWEGNPYVTALTVLALQGGWPWLRRG
ncbi:prenyltransferase/squalene oxidase repeat-containing protein [Thermoflexus sp.]|uniref:prenyltransferase/squalene oxidase repeat-containing protein n=1 Tax=Thermoflexus sp. TaxID=1969742 RepID=UPI00181DC7AB|nr:prenyltransferase/squalene oxidase repeat-containing protein [Thermoflexus sp.]